MSDNKFYDEKSQLGILTYMLADKTLRAMAIDALHPNDFDGVDRKLFGMIYEARGEFSPFTADLSQDMTERITEGQALRLDDPDESLFKSWIENIQAMTKRRGLRLVGQAILNKVTPEASPDDISMVVVEQVAALSNRENAQADMTIGQATALSNENEQAWADGDPFHDTIETGFVGYDKTMGGYARGHIHILAGETSMGKTALMLSIMLNMARAGKRVYMFSMDMNGPTVGTRVQQIISSVSAKELRFPADMITKYGEQGYQERRKRFRDAGVQVDELSPNFIIQPSTGLSTAQMYSKAMMQHAIMPIDCVVLDYLELPTSTGENETATVNATLQGMKLIANHLNCAVVVLAQFGKGINNKASRVPDNEMIKGSSKTYQIAETVSFIYRPGYYYEPGEGFKTPAVKKQSEWCDERDCNSFIKIGKGREFGRNQRVRLVFNEDTATFTDPPHSGELERSSPSVGKNTYRTQDQFGGK